MGALSHIKVLDLSRILAGPWASQVLGDLGATVVKIERPDGGDDTRTWWPPYLGTESAYFLSTNRNKKSVTVDFTKPEGQEVKSQVQPPDAQICPVVHSGPVPQLQVPSEEQPSARAEGHAKHTAPLTPQLEPTGVRQLGPEQQPWQLEAQPLHSPFSQDCP